MRKVAKSVLESSRPERFKCLSGVHRNYSSGKRCRFIPRDNSVAIHLKNSSNPSRSLSPIQKLHGSE